MIVGYARCSTTEQRAGLDGQIAFLTEKMQAEKIFAEIASGAKGDRPELRVMLDFVRPGDIVVVQRLDRLARSLKDLLRITDTLSKREVHLRSSAETIDTTSAVGKLIFHVFAALSEFELNLIRERTAAGLENARKRGRLGGRPEKLSEQQKAVLQAVYDKGDLTVAEICGQLGISRSTAYKHLRKKVTAC